MAMEYRVGGTEVLLTLDKAYVAEDDTALLQQVSRFKPLVDYLTTFKPQDSVVSVLTINNVTTIAGRIASIRGRITLKHKVTKETQTEALALSDESRAVVLPVLSVGTAQYAALVRRPRLAIGGALITEAFEGTFAKEDGAFVAEGSELLKALGFHITDKTCSALSSEAISFSDGNPPVKVLRASKVFTDSAFADATRSAIQSDDATLVIVPIEEVATQSTDAKAVVAASLLLRAKA
jgi:hypothetical protein